MTEQLVTMADLAAGRMRHAEYRIERLWPADRNVIFTTHERAGISNVVRSLADGDPFLGYAVRPVGEGRRVALIDFELAETDLSAWLMNEGGVRNADRVALASCRGSRDLGAFNGDVDRCAELVARLRASRVETLVLGPVDDVAVALALDTPDGMAAFFRRLDALATEAGIPEVLVSHRACLPWVHQVISWSLGVDKEPTTGAWSRYFQASSDEGRKTRVPLGDADDAELPV